jgi:ribosomal protein S18 acetylase RimI-like enzyme
MPLPDVSPLPDFPARHAAIPVCAEPAAFRRATRNDLTFLRALYRSLRADEFAPLAWPPEQVGAFLDQQFDLQHRAYVVTFPQADFLLILWEGMPVGRLYLDASRDHWHIVDIGLTSERRNGGLGFAVMQAVKQHAQASAAAGIVLHVACDNQGAQRFYRRLGFREVAREEPTYARMVWTPGPNAVPGQVALPAVN